MSLRRLPVFENLDRPDDDEVLPGDREFETWQNLIDLKLATAPSGKVLDIFGPIGKNPFTGEGVNDQDVRNALKGAENSEITVNINSPGGSAFTGLAIYSMLAQHSGKVTVNILGVAASAASIIAMSGDLIRISDAGSVMIHNAQAGIFGDRHDLEDGVAALEQLDAAIRRIYASRTSQDDAELDRMMTPSVGTWLFGQEAIDKGFADELVAVEKGDATKSEKKKAPTRATAARAQLNAVLAKQGLSRTMRRELIRDAFPGKVSLPVEQAPSPSRAFSEIANSIRAVAADVVGKPRAVDTVTPRADHLGALDSLGRMVEKL